MEQHDIEVLRELGRQVAEIAALPAQEETRRLWWALNGLRPVRPLVMIDELPWNEMDVDGDLVAEAQDPFCRGLETTLRRTLYQWRHFPVDMVFESEVYIPKTIRTTGFGLVVQGATLSMESENEILSHEYGDQLSDEEDVHRIRTPELSLDEEATARDEARAHEIFDGILDVRMQGWIPPFYLWDDIVTWRGGEAVLYDLIDRPDHMHEIARRYTDASLGMLDQLEEKGLLGYNAPLVHCTGAWTDELPAPGFDPARPRAKDNWTRGASQILGSVSKTMYEEFEIKYVSRWHARFGLTNYGCCDPLHDRVDLIRRIPNVRKISMSPWADVDKGAEAIGRDYVFSWKPNPAGLAMDSWDAGAVEADIRHTMEACERNGCALGITLKDISTVRHHPERVWEWARIASRLVGREASSW
ncbi:MAG: hypothetical protein ACHQ50_13665 [Fimbriimonadales bacterium]